MPKKISLFTLLFFALALIIFSSLRKGKLTTPFASLVPISDSPFAIQAMRKRDYLGSQMVIEQRLKSGSNYSRLTASYKSDGYKIYGLLTVPNGQVPEGGWPAIIFNHGYIRPDLYRTTERYVAYVDELAKSGYVVFKSDYRGHGSSEGPPESGYFSPSYTIDILNALSSVKKLSMVNPEKIGMWGHSMGGNLTLRSLVISKDIKVAVIWAGVTASYKDLINNWLKKIPATSPVRQQVVGHISERKSLVDKFGTPEQNPAFWHSIDPMYFLGDIQTPIQLHHGEVDQDVPIEFTTSLDAKLKSLGKTVEFYPYSTADHNFLDSSFSLAMKRTIQFFDKYLKK